MVRHLTAQLDFNPDLESPSVVSIAFPAGLLNVVIDGEGESPGAVGDNPAALPDKERRAAVNPAGQASFRMARKSASRAGTSGRAFWVVGAPIRTDVLDVARTDGGKSTQVMDV